MAGWRLVLVLAVCVWSSAVTSIAKKEVEVATPDDQQINADGTEEMHPVSDRSPAGDEVGEKMETMLSADEIAALQDMEGGEVDEDTIQSLNDQSQKEDAELEVSTRDEAAAQTKAKSTKREPLFFFAPLLQLVAGAKGVAGNVGRVIRNARTTANHVRRVGSRRRRWLSRRRSASRRRRATRRPVASRRRRSWFSRRRRASRRRRTSRRRVVARRRSWLSRRRRASRR